jgi:Flp pilus assembly protein TadG
MIRWNWRRKPDACREDERGQALILFAGGLVVFMGLVALAVDVGQIVTTRTDLQKAADAAAFAGAQDLPNTASARTVAEQYVANNAGGEASAHVTFGSTGSQPNEITVEAERRVNYTFMRVLGMSGADVSASATVRVGTYSGGGGLVPWGLIASNDYNSTLLQNDCFINIDAGGNANFKQNQQCVLKYGAGTSSGGDFGALALDGTGASIYRDNIGKGSQKVFKKGDQVEAQTGNMQGPTQQGISDRFSQPVPDGCPGHGRNDVLITNDDGTVSVRPGCDSSPRIVIIPVVDKIDNPQMSTILGFAFMYLTGSTNQGGQSQVYGEFVEFVTELPNSLYEGTGTGAKAIRLID